MLSGLACGTNDAGKVKLYFLSFSLQLFSDVVLHWSVGTSLLDSRAFIKVLIVKSVFASGDED